MPFREPFQIGEIYHVINRGVDKRKIFMNDRDYLRFILGLYFFNDKKRSDIWFTANHRKDEIMTAIGPPDRPVERSAANNRDPIVELMAFALMPNHYHLLLREIEEGGISAFMKKMGGYTWYFNKQHERSGTLFQGRYKAVHIKDEIQLGNIFTYIHTNPVELVEPGWKDSGVRNKMNALKKLNTYKWSSYQDYIGRPTFPFITQREFFLERFGNTDSCRRVVEDWVSVKVN